jgi:HSP20 family protein
MFSLTPYFYRREVDPFREFEKLERQLFSAPKQRAFRTDITDKGDSFLLEAELPGFAKENINVNIEGETLTITAERGESKENENEGLIQRERVYGKFVRRFDISQINEEGITASYKDGILELVLPKKQEETPKSRKLEIN